jgi:hypothetical protein
VPGTGIRAWSACSDKERCTETYILLATVDGFCTEGWNFDLNHGNRPLSSSPRRSRRGARSIDMVEIGSRIAPFCTNLSARAVRSQRLLRASMQMDTGGGECQVTGKCDETRCLAHRRGARSFCRVLGGPARAQTSVKSFTIVPPACTSRRGGKPDMARDEEVARQRFPPLASYSHPSVQNLSTLE